MERENANYKNSYVFHRWPSKRRQIDALNALTGEKIAIVSAKPQTTRNRISGIVNRAGVQYIFMDTPGFHKPKNKLGDYMVGVVHETVSDTDAAILVVEPREPGRQEQMLTREIAEQGLSCVLVINKIDTVDKREILGVIEAYTKLGEFAAIVPLCAHGRRRFYFDGRA